MVSSRDKAPDFSLGADHPISYVKKFGGSNWGIGTTAPSFSQEGMGFASVNEINKCGFYSISGSNTGAQAGSSTLLHIHRQWAAGAVGFQLNFSTLGRIYVRSLDGTDDTTQWGAWKQLADQDWVMENIKVSPG